MAIDSVRLKNFTLFDDFQLKVSSGINIFIGENGTGKTHLLKAIYGACSRRNEKFRGLSFSNYFRAGENKFSKNSEVLISVNPLDNEYKNFDAVYIPVKDMLTHSKGLPSMAEKYRDFPFDKTLIDIILKASQWKIKEIPDLAKSILPVLEDMMGGKVIRENEEFFIRKYDGKIINFAFEAEGFKKIGLLWQLIMTENIKPKTILIWEEPEANLNPKFLPQIVECLLELSRHNVQIFVSTHNYIFAKYFNVRARKNDLVVFHGLYKDGNSVKCESNENFANLEHNAIIQTFNQLLEEMSKD